MSELSEEWPLKSDTDKVDLKICPHCGRKLLTLTSTLCNWCGKKIDNPEYQEKAAQTRLEQDRHDREQVKADTRQDTRPSLLGRLSLGSNNKPPKKPRNELSP